MKPATKINYKEVANIITIVIKFKKLSNFLIFNKN